MNWIKRAFRSISYHKKNTILMFLSFLIRFHIKNIWNSALMKEFGLAAVIR